MAGKLNVTVLGATGFLGRFTAFHFLLQGHNVRVQGRNPQKCEELANLTLTEDLEIVFGLTKEQLKQFKFSEVIQISNEFITPDICAGQDIIINCIGDVTILQADKNYERGNVDVIPILIEGCLKYNTKLIHTSSPSVYANYHSRKDISEDEPLPNKPATGYAASKRKAEEIIMRAQSENNLRAVQLRPHLVIGPKESHIIAPMLKMILEGRVPIFNDGKALVDLTYIGNFIQAVDLCATSEEAVGKIYNITNGEPQEFMQILQILAQTANVNLYKLPIPIRFETAQYILGFMDLMNKGLQWVGIGTKPFVSRYSASVMAQDTTLNLSNLKSIGYQPTTAIKDGMIIATKWSLKHDPSLQTAKGNMPKNNAVNEEEEPLDWPRKNRHSFLSINRS
jgi:nucleoside-diphosphate-sugar epimerase